ncbi:MAG: DNA-directed RNA polymerase subunit E'' [Candidatus Aenigmarchaeota archaeon]|nr:DNA-directed RNA polymerase subunit E'' [Candidatus Aenigmarchaeota archaeon]
MAEKACKKCRRLVKGNICPVCKSTELTRSWRGIILVLNSESEIAKEAGITTPGKYASRVK